MIIEQKIKTNVINEVIALTKTFDGDVFGEAIRDYRICGQTNIPKIDIRLENSCFKPFTILMHSKYHMTEQPGKIINGVNINSFRISPKPSSSFFMPITLDIVLMTRPLFRVSFIDFEINLLTESEKAMFLRFVPSIIKYIPDKLSFVKDRIIARQFTCLPCDRPLQDTCYTVDKAIELTNRGWTMDDLNHAKSTWVVGKWEGFIAGKHRKTFTREQYNKLIESNTCSLCHEKFQGTDIVFNSACNHVFHWRCNPNNGLCCWAKEHTTCPYCRSEMFV